MTNSKKAVLCLSLDTLYKAVQWLAISLLATVKAQQMLSHRFSPFSAFFCQLLLQSFSWQGRKQLFYRLNASLFEPFSPTISLFLKPSAVFAVASFAARFFFSCFFNGGSSFFIGLLFSSSSFLSRFLGSSGFSSFLKPSF